MAVLLDNPVRSYAWGSTTVIPDLLGVEPTTEPQAELWVGAHPGAPSKVVQGGPILGKYIAEDPGGRLGAETVARFGPVLPYLLKILAIERPLSIQAHPTIEQAEQGYAAEDAAGVPLGASNRSYRDRNHKPEMVVALTGFEALLGFREPREVAALLEETGRGEFVDSVALLRGGDTGLGDVVAAWLSLSEMEAGRLVEVLTEEALAERSVERFAEPSIAEPLAVVGRLAEIYPGDRGLLLALLMRHVQLRPGEAAFIAAGVPHAYLSGVAVEVQASSDNTLRAGLTSKHVDTAEIERILRYEPSGGLSVQPEDIAAGEQLYPVPGLEEFRLCRLSLSGSEIRPSGWGPRIVLVVEGRARLRILDDEPGAPAPDAHVGALELGPGQAAFVPASDGAVALTGDGVAFTVTPNL